jgi:hypothetical protein
MMKKIIVFLPFFLFISACVPSDAQIQTAIHKTQTAIPTVTSSPHPTITPTPAPTPTPDFVLLEGVDYSSLKEKFSIHDAPCNEKGFEEDGSYESTCEGNFEGGMIQGFIIGNSEDTVSSFSYLVIPYINAMNEYYIKGALVDFIDFGESVADKQQWIIEAVNETLERKNDDIMIKDYEDVRLIVTGAQGVVGLLVAAKE